MLLSRLDKAYLSTAPTLGVVEAAFGTELTSYWLEVQITTIDMFQGSRTGDSESIAELSKLILSQYKSLKLSEFALFIARFKLGMYGKFYGAFDAIAVAEALKKFVKDKEIEIDVVERRVQAEKRNETRKMWPEGFTSLSWYQECKKRRAANDVAWLEEHKEFLKQ